MTRVLTTADVEWMLTDEYEVARRGNTVWVLTDPLLAVFTIADEDSTWLGMQSMVAESVPPSHALYRWIATEGANNLLGSLLARPNDDGMVDVYFRHTVIDRSVHAEDLQSTVALMTEHGAAMARQIQRLFG